MPTHRQLISKEARGLSANVLRGLLSCCVPFYGSAVRIRNRLFDLGWKPISQAGVPVISVGNLTTGGTGKTPIVAMLANWFQRRGRNVCLLSRGYRALDDTGQNDEQRVLERLCPGIPHLQHPDRVSSAARACGELSAEVLILDDGFQHRRLARDLDIVLIDALNPWGYDALLPRGLLREPRSGLRRADLVIITRCDLCDVQTLARLQNEIERLHPGVPIVESQFSPAGWVNLAGDTVGLNRFESDEVVAFSGIGNPEGFRSTLDHCGLQIAEFISFPDHFHYRQADVDQLCKSAHRQGCKTIVTTYKDLVKLGDMNWNGLEVWALELDTTLISGASELDAKLCEIDTAIAPVDDSEP